MFRVTPGQRAGHDLAAANFPSSIAVYQQAYQNWAGMIVIDDVWTCAPTSAGEVVTLANWAYANGYRLRRQGDEPWLVTDRAPGGKHRGRVRAGGHHPVPDVGVRRGRSPGHGHRAGRRHHGHPDRGVAAAGYGLCAIPAPGDITLGGALAINAHGSAIPATGETPLSGQTYGSLSNLILSLTAVVWSSAAGQYVLQTFQRDDPDIRAFLAHLGRAFVTAGHPAGRGQPEPALPELGRHLGGRPVRAARHRRLQFPRELRERRRAGRGHLVPVHRARPG